MNKDVIYIEPEDDITDIIAKIEKAKEKIVALVPPKKAGVFRSLVNIKLIAKTSAAADKTVVLVTVDPSIVKLAAATKIPVAKNLQSAPTVPTADTEEPSTEHTIEDLPDDEDAESEATLFDEGEQDEGADSDSSSSSSRSAKHKSAPAEDEDIAEDEEEEEEEPKPAKKEKKSPKAGGNKFLAWFKLHKKLSILGGVLAVALIAFLVWAFGFAPAADVTVMIKTDSRNFSETANFVTSASEENAKEGKLYLEQKKLEETQEVTFDATGQKNQGDRASGEVTVIGTVSSDGGTKVINTGDVFTINGLSYSADNSVTMHYDGKDDSVCSNADTVTKREFDAQGCRIYAKVKVTAREGGEKYNISATSSGWNTTASVEVYSESAMTGGTDKIVTVVQQSDIENAKNQLTSAKEEENKNKLYDSIGDDYYIIDVSFEQSTSATTATPGAGEEVKDGEKPKLTATTTATVYVVEKSKIEEYINAKADLEDDQKIYGIDNIYVESLSPVGDGYTGRVKAQYYVGPKITEAEVVEKIGGKGLGDAQRELRDLYGVSDVRIDTSYPWVTSIPGDSNKVNVSFDIKDQGANGGADKSSTSGDSGSSDSDDNQESEN